MVKTISTHKYSILSVLLMVVAAVLGADSGFAMAVEVADGVRTPEGVRDEAQKDHLNLDTQLQGKSATATDVRDAGLEAEDIDPDVAKFRPFRFPVEWYIATKCKQVKSKSYEHLHFRSGATVLEDKLVKGTTVSITGKTPFSISCGDLANSGAAMTECSEVFVPSVNGYADDGKTIDGSLALYVVENNDETVKFIAINPGSTAISIPVGATFVVAATACSESQMNVAPESYLPESDTLYLQKKIANVIITDEWKEQAKKVKFITQDVLHNGLFNFKRKCARTHWEGRQARIDVKVKELNGNREAAYFERGILRQIPYVYTFSGNTLTFEDFMGITRMQFAKNSESNDAVMFCGLDVFQMIQKFAYTTSVHNGSVKYEDINEMGINIKRWKDALGTLDIIHDPTLDDIGRADQAAVIDIKNAVRYFKRNEQQETSDMKKTGEAREAERTRISMIDCIGLKGYNAVLVTPEAKLKDALQLGGVSSHVITAPAGLTSTDSLDKSKKYYLPYTIGSHNAGTIIEYKGSAWQEFTGTLNAA